MEFDYNFWIGVVGGVLVVLGAAWPEPKKKIHPTKALKNWLFVFGGIFLFAYSVIGYLQGGPVFFIFLQALIAVSMLLMMLNTPDKYDTPIITTAGIILVVWSLILFESYNTIFFVLGLSGLGLGYAFQMGTLRRSVALTLGSALIAVFSYIEASWVFFWLNVFFAIFSGYYLIKGLIPRRKAVSS